MVVVKNMKRFFSARGMSLGLILFLAGVMYLSTLIPQRVEATAQQIESWRFAHAGLTRVADVFSLHSVYVQPWFAAAILLAALALGISSVDQLKACRKKLCAISTASADEVSAGVSGMLLRSVARANSYRLLRSTPDGELKFVRNPWGYFGSLMLHTGITVVILASSYVAVTARQGALILVEGEQHGNSQPWALSEHGLLADPLKLPGTIRLDRVRVQFDGRQQPVDVSSDVSLTDPSGQVDRVTASINRIVSYRGLRIYHASQYGTAFAVTFTGKNGAVHGETIAAHHPLNPAEAGYSDEFGVDWTSDLLSAKYYADADRKTLNSAKPELTLRLTRGGREVARTTLTQGEGGQLGEYRVQLNRISRWAKLIVVDTGGMPLIFTGFAVIMLGGLLRYLAPPRELIAFRLPDDRYRVFWRAVSFRDFFVEERDELIAALHKEQAI